MPLTDWDLWASAQHVVTVYGDGALDHVDDRIHELVLKADEEGVGVWIAIADRIKALTAAPQDHDSKH